MSQNYQDPNQGPGGQDPYQQQSQGGQQQQGYDPSQQQGYDPNQSPGGQDPYQQQSQGGQQQQGYDPNQQQGQWGQQGQQQQGQDPFGAKQMAEQQIDSAIDQFAGKIPGGQQYSPQAKDAAAGALDTLEQQGEEEAKKRLGNLGGIFGGDQGNQGS